jgi:hypothetical protein
MGLSTLRVTATLRRWLRAAITIAFFSALFGCVFVVAAIVSLLPDTLYAPLSVFNDAGLLFLVLGAAYGTIVALDRSAPKVIAMRKWLKPFHSPYLRAMVCSALGTAAAWVIWRMASHAFSVPWVLVGTVLGFLFGWFGWRWARYIDF